MFFQEQSWADSIRGLWSPAWSLVRSAIVACHHGLPSWLLVRQYTSRTQHPTGASYATPPGRWGQLHGSLSAAKGDIHQNDTSIIFHHIAQVAILLELFFAFWCYSHMEKFFRRKNTALQELAVSCTRITRITMVFGASIVRACLFSKPLKSKRKTGSFKTWKAKGGVHCANFQT